VVDDSLPVYGFAPPLAVSTVKLGGASRYPQRATFQRVRARAWQQITDLDLRLCRICAVLWRKRAILWAMAALDLNFNAAMRDITRKKTLILLA
jgi:hypothetical protein